MPLQTKIDKKPTPPSYEKQEYDPALTWVSPDGLLISHKSRPFANKINYDDMDYKTYKQKKQEQEEEERRRKQLQEEAEERQRQKEEEDKQEEKRKRREHYESLCEKYGVTDWSEIKQKQAEERVEEKEKQKKEYLERKKAREEWWEENKDRILAARERSRREYEERRAARSHYHSKFSGQPIPGAWRTANRPDGW